MTAYIASIVYGLTNASTTCTLAVQAAAGGNGIRVVKVELRSGSQSVNPLTLLRYSGASLSSGTTVTPRPLREPNAPTATSTAKSNATISGTSVQLYGTALNGATDWTYQFAFDQIVAAGSAFVVSSVVGAANNVVFIDVQYEELHLARSS